jgi:hypothetical protein
MHYPSLVLTGTNPSHESLPAVLKCDACISWFCTTLSLPRCSNAVSASIDLASTAMHVRDTEHITLDLEQYK